MNIFVRSLPRVPYGIRYSPTSRLVVRKVFYTFLAMSILLGVFLILLGWWISTGRDASASLAMAILLMGGIAATIHSGYYFPLRITRWISRSGTFFHKDESKA